MHVLPPLLVSDWKSVHISHPQAAVVSGEEAKLSIFYFIFFQKYLRKSLVLGTVTWKAAPFSVNVKYDHEPNMVFQVFCYFFIWNTSNLMLAMDPYSHLTFKKIK